MPQKHLSPIKDSCIFPSFSFLLILWREEMDNLAIEIHEKTEHIYFGTLFFFFSPLLPSGVVLF